MKRIFPLFAAAVLLAVLASCSRAKDYTIRGRFDLPDTLSADAALRIAEMLEGLPVYLLDLRGELLDSALVEGGEFAMQGTVEAPHFAYLASNLAVNMIVVEEGDILITYGESENVASGTPSNDGIGRLEDALTELQAEGAERMEALRAALPDGSLAEGDTAVQQAAMLIFFDVAGRMDALLDSTITAHPEDLVGVYAVHMRTADAATPEELEEALEGHSAFIRENELFVTRLEYLRELNDAPASFGSEMFDPEMFDPAALGLVPGEEGE